MGRRDMCSFLGVRHVIPASPAPSSPRLAIQGGVVSRQLRLALGEELAEHLHPEGVAIKHGMDCIQLSRFEDARNQPFS